jgi:hypothetical protein
MAATKGAQAPQKAAAPSLAKLLSEHGGNACFYSPFLVEDSRALWDMLREVYGAVIEPDRHSDSHVALAFDVEGVPVRAVFFRRDVGVKTTSTVERYVIEGEPLPEVTP